MFKKFLARWTVDHSARENARPQANGNASGVKKVKSAERHWNFNAEEAELFLRENETAILLDVRTPEEFAAGHIQGARNVDFFSPRFQETVASFDREIPCLLHCESGQRSGRARAIMNRLNFRAVYHLDGGVKAWTQAGKPLVRE